MLVILIPRLLFGWGGNHCFWFQEHPHPHYNNYHQEESNHNGDAFCGTHFLAYRFLNHRQIGRITRFTNCSGGQQIPRMTPFSTATSLSSPSAIFFLIDGNPVGHAYRSPNSQQNQND